MVKQFISKYHLSKYHILLMIFFGETYINYGMQVNHLNILIWGTLIGHVNIATLPLV
jgi:hypothetical protein